MVIYCKIIKTLVFRTLTNVAKFIFIYTVRSACSLKNSHQCSTNRLPVTVLSLNNEEIIQNVQVILLSLKQ